MKKNVQKEAIISAVATVRNVSGLSILKRKDTKLKADRSQYLPDKQAVEQTKKEIKKLGFEILSSGKFGVTFSGPQKLFEKIFQTKCEKKEVKILKGEKKGESFYFKPIKPCKVPDKLANLIEDVSVGEPPILVNAVSPEPSYFHLDVPSDIAALMKARHLHNIGIIGKGVKVAMPDTGFHDHPYYNNKNYHVKRLAVPASDPFLTDDFYGHGTAIASNLLAIAPGIEFIPIKVNPGQTGDYLGGFHCAVAQKPDIITCSWIWDIDKPGSSHGDLDPYKLNLEWEIRDAVNHDRITVIFACGNGQYGWPASMPEVISVGGVFIDQNYTLHASDYASSFESSIYPGRHCPDVCGLVGPAPWGIYIVMPTQPESWLDKEFAGCLFPQKDDGTDKDDGWIVASGTSSAAPMVAGVVALRMQSFKKRDPYKRKLELKITARAVTQGKSYMGDHAFPRWNQATGYGLVDAQAVYCLPDIPD